MKAPEKVEGPKTDEEVRGWSQQKPTSDASGERRSISRSRTLVLSKGGVGLAHNPSCQEAEWGSWNSWGASTGAPQKARRLTHDPRCHEEPESKQGYQDWHGGWNSWHHSAHWKDAGSWRSGWNQDPGYHSGWSSGWSAGWASPQDWKPDAELKVEAQLATGPTYVSLPSFTDPATVERASTSEQLRCEDLGVQEPAEETASTQTLFYFGFKDGYYYAKNLSTGAIDQSKVFEEVGILSPIAAMLKTWNEDPNLEKSTVSDQCVVWKGPWNDAAPDAASWSSWKPSDYIKAEREPERGPIVKKVQMDYHTKPVEPNSGAPEAKAPAKKLHTDDSAKDAEALQPDEVTKAKKRKEAHARYMRFYRSLSSRSLRDLESAELPI